MYINQFSVVVFKRQHYVFHIFTGYTFVRRFPACKFTIPQRHRRTDGRTTSHGNTALRIASRGKNYIGLYYDNYM